MNLQAHTFCMWELNDEKLFSTTSFIEFKLKCTKWRILSFTILFFSLEVSTKVVAVFNSASFCWLFSRPYKNSLEYSKESDEKMKMVNNSQENLMDLSPNLMRLSWDFSCHGSEYCNVFHQIFDLSWDSHEILTSFELATNPNYSKLVLPCTCRLLSLLWDQSWTIIAVAYDWEDRHSYKSGQAWRYAIEVKSFLFFFLFFHSRNLENK